MQEQSFKSHAKFVPAFHYFVVPVLLINVINSVIRAYHSFNYEHAFGVVLALALLTLAFVARTFALKVQDRVIRLEERLRLQALAPAEWHAQIYRLTEDQLIGLRFASDDEVVELAKQALEHNLTRKQIKERINNWRGDYWRV